MSTVLLENLNSNFRNVEFAIKGELDTKADEYREKLKNKNHGLPFDKVISSNIGNPQQKGLDQKPLTFNRQVSVLLYTESRSLHIERSRRSWSTPSL